MRMTIRNLTGKLPEADQESIARLVDFAVSRFESDIDAVQVTLRDTNGPKGGVDQECRILVSLKDGVRLNVKETQLHPLAGVAKAADRMSHVIARRLERRREIPHVRFS